MRFRKKLSEAPPIKKNDVGFAMRIPITPPVQVSQVQFHMDNVGSVPVLRVMSGNKALTPPVTFGSLLTDPAIWDHDALNDILYQLDRGYYSKDSYDFFGLVNAHGNTYLGIRWYSPAASAQDLVAGVILQIQCDGSQVAMRLLKTYYWGSGAGRYRGSKAPLLTRSQAGDLVLEDWNGTWRLDVQGHWQPVH